MISLKYIAFMLSSLSVTACGSGGAVADGDVLASVGTSMLTVDDLRDNTPLGLSSEDSVLFCRAYIKQWIDSRLVSEIAVRNISGTEKIDKMVEEYRNDLIMKEYKRLMYEENGGRWFSVDTLKSYYCLLYSFDAAQGTSRWGLSAPPASPCYSCRI